MKKKLLIATLILLLVPVWSNSQGFGFDGN
jgi:hypothetical protein